MNKLLKYFFPTLGILLSTVSANSLFAQGDTCNIEINVPLPVCPEYIFKLSVPFHENYTYQWKENNTTLDEDGNELLTSITEETTFSVMVTDTLSGDKCGDTLIVTAYPQINIAFDQLQLTCTSTFSDNPDDESKSKTAILKAVAGDEFDPDEYTYLWDISPLQIDPQDSSIAIGLSAYQKYFIDVKDNYGCIMRDTAIPKAYPNPVIDIVTDPPDTVYIQRPYATFSYINLSEDSIQVTNHVWDFGDCLDVALDDPCLSDVTKTQDMPVHTYSEIGDYYPTILVYSQYGCDTIYGDTIHVVPVNLKIPNVFTPNDDGTNDEFVIKIDNTANEDEGGIKSISATATELPLSTYYERSELVIFNRQGRVVYKSNDYKNDWDGDKLSDGVYFYVLKCFGAKSDDVYKGSVTIYGSGR